jgi:hypothetical protein
MGGKSFYEGAPRVIVRRSIMAVFRANLNSSQGTANVEKDSSVMQSYLQLAKARDSGLFDLY